MNRAIQPNRVERGDRAGSDLGSTSGKIKIAIGEELSWRVPIRTPATVGGKAALLYFRVADPPGRTVYQSF